MVSRNKYLVRLIVASILFFVIVTTIFAFFFLWDGAHAKFRRRNSLARRRFGLWTADCNLYQKKSESLSRTRQSLGPTKK